MDEINVQLEMPAWATIVSHDGYSILKGEHQHCHSELQWSTAKEKMMSS